MAERSFAREVEDLRLGDGEIFRGEGILAITKALLQSGVSYVGGYQGSPISHLMDVLADAKDVMDELGVHFETSASEAAAAAMLSASVMYPLRGAVTWKSTAGTNVAVRRAVEPGVGRRHRRRADHHRRGLRRRLLDHAGAQPRLRDEVADLAARSAPQPADRIVKAVETGFELSEASNTPVCWRCASAPATCTASSSPRTTSARPSRCAQALENPSRDVNRIVLPPASFLHEKEKLEKRWPAAVEFIKSAQAQRVLRPGGGRCRHHRPGRAVQRA